MALPRSEGRQIVSRIEMKLTGFSVVIAIAAQTCLSQSVSYYVDAIAGGDGNDGRSPASAWRSLEKVNAQTFKAGDRILLKSGSVWTGSLAPKGSGSEGKPIMIDKFGGDAKPRIDGAGMIGSGVVRLHNQEYWEINSIEITNDASAPGDRRGVLVSAAEAGVLHHIYLKNLDIHHIKGIAGNDNAAKRTAGIGIETISDTVLATRFDDILIEGCTLCSIDNTGLYTDNSMPKARDEYPGTGKWPQRRFTNVQIRKNVIHHVAKNAMIMRFLDKGVVEHNICYETALKTTGNTMFASSCDGTVFQYNEGSFNRSTGGDGSMYDADLRSPNTVWQYSYSHDNAHGLFWTCTVQADANIVCRYNISQNDRGIIFCINYPNTSVYCYNNTVYCGPKTSPTMIAERNNGGAGPRTYFFFNNIIYNQSSSAQYLFQPKSYNRTIDYNVFYGNHPANEPQDPHKISSDPLLSGPGGGGTGIGSLEGYKLQSGSPCIDSGLLLKEYGRSDFFGNPLPVDGLIDRGASEYQNTNGAKVDAAK
jgi:hypothetical protein